MKKDGGLSYAAVTAMRQICNELLLAIAELATPFVSVALTAFSLTSPRAESQSPEDAVVAHALCIFAIDRVA